MNAWNELHEAFNETEHLEAIVFGAYGWGSFPQEGQPWHDGYCEIENKIPYDLRGEVLSPDKAEPLMKSWKISGGYGAPNCYAFYAWTNKSVYWVTQYDGSTRLCSAPRNPVNCQPEMPGG